MREAAGIGSTSRASVYNAEPVQNIDEAGEDPDLHLLRTSTVQHGLNLNPCTFATISNIEQRTTIRRHHWHHGAPAIATGKHAPIRAQASLETASTVGWWKDAGRDESKRSECAKCTRRSHAAANIDDQA